MNWLLYGDTEVSTAMVKCPDGVALATDVYRSRSADRPRPTIVERTPYGRNSSENQATARYFVERGYNVVMQDTRGRGDSEGIFRHYISDPHEGEDGFSLLEWIDGQPWSNGSVGTIGFSYTGSNQQSLAIMGHPSLRAQVIYDAAINYGRRTVREEGAFVLGQLGTYALRMALSSPQARKDPVLRAELEAVRDQAPDWFRLAPWSKGSSPVSAIPEYEEWLLFAQDTVVDDDRWRNPQMNIEPYLKQYPDIPILYLSSWYGHHVWSTMRRIEKLKHHHSPKHVVIGTWLHADPYGFNSHTGAVEFGAAASLNTNEMRRRFFDQHLLNSPPPAHSEIPKYSYFRMGGGAERLSSSGLLEHGGSWHYSETWPPTLGADLSLRLTAKHGLVPSDSKESQGSGAIKLKTDTRLPIPSVGGSIRNPDIIPGFFREGAQDQREWPDVLDSPGSGLPLHSRPDVAMFRTEAFTEATDITGPLMLDLWVSSTSSAADISVKIIDEYPSSPELPTGFSLNIADYFQRFASWTEEFRPGEPRQVVIGPIHVSNLFAPGHRLRIDIGTSNWPRYDKNPEADRQYTLTIHTEPDRASTLSGSGVIHR